MEGWVEEEEKGGGDSWGIGPGWERQEVGEEDETGRSPERETGDGRDKYRKWFEILHSSSFIVKKKENQQPWRHGWHSVLTMNQLKWGWQVARSCEKETTKMETNNTK